MENWINIEEKEPPKIFGNAYKFLIELASDKTEKIEDRIIAIWTGNDWYLKIFEETEGYQNMSGIEYFKINKPKKWRVYKAPNVTD